MIRNQISSTIEDLNYLHTIYPWIPNDSCIRPNPQELIKKQQIILHINNQWESTRDYILYTIFKQKYLEINKETGRLSVREQPFLQEWILDPCIFRYNLPEYVNHDILWNQKYIFTFDFESTKINSVIVSILEKKLGHPNFDFAWYKNPKPSVIDFYHVQVFWIVTTQ